MTKNGNGSASFLSFAELCLSPLALQPTSSASSSEALFSSEAGTGSVCPLLPLPSPARARSRVLFASVYFSTIIAVPLSLACVWLIPDPKSINHHPVEAKKEGVEEAPKRKPKMDYLVRFCFLALLLMSLTVAPLSL